MSLLVVSFPVVAHKLMTPTKTEIYLLRIVVTLLIVSLLENFSFGCPPYSMFTFLFFSAVLVIGVSLWLRKELNPTKNIIIFLTAILLMILNSRVLFDLDNLRKKNTQIEQFRESSNIGASIQPSRTERV